MSAVQEIVWKRLSADSAITARVGTTEPRIFPGPDNVPQGSRGKRPRIVYRVISEDEVTDSDAGPTGLIVVRVQVDCQDTTAELARSLSDLVRKGYASGGPLNGFFGAVSGTTWTVDRCFKIDGRDELDFEDIGGRTVSMDFELAYY